MKISVRVEKQVCIFELNAHFNRSAIQGLETKILDYLDNTEIKGLIFDLDKTTFIDSFGIGIIANTYKWTNEVNKGFCLCRLSQKVLFTIRITHLHTAIPIADTLEEAIQKIEGE